MSQAEIGPDLDASKYTPAQFELFKAKFPEQSTNTLARFLIAREGNVENASTLLSNHLVWRKENLPALKETCIAEFETGKAYIRGTDLQGHPILHFHTYLHDPYDRHIEELIRMTLFVFETALRKLENNLSKITVLINRVGASSGSDIEFAKQLTGILQNNYPERLYRTIVYPSGMIFYGIWQVVQLFMDPVSRQKVKPVMYLSGVTEYIDRKYIPVQMGGTDDYVFKAEDFPDPYPESEIVAKRAQLALAKEKKDETTSE